jgi:plasmid stabilization system protein ParE
VTYRIEFSRAALTDQRRLIAFVEEASPKAGAYAVDVLASAFETLSMFPYSGTASRSGRVLIVRFGRGGYAIRYRVYSASVLISRIFHTREDR